MIRVAIIEDQPQTRQMLSDLLQANQEIDFKAAYNDAEQALAEIDDEIDVMLVDIHLPGMSGNYFVASAKKKFPAIQFIMCSSLEDSENIFNALQAGACGYITKASSMDRLVDAIKDAYNGGAPMSSQIARKVIGFFQNQKPAVNLNELNKLSAREQEILNYLAKGYRYKEISSFLFINIETVRKHIHNIYEKLHVNSRTDALNRVFPK